MADDIVTRLLARLAPWQRDYLKKAPEAPRGKKVDLVIVDEIYVEDGFGSRWMKCTLPDCSLQVVRPGKVQCNDQPVETEFGIEWIPPCA